MTTITFDTLRYTERLRAAGVPEQQAKAEAEALRDVLSESLDSTLATKSDMRDVRDDVAKLDKELALVKADIGLVKWMMGILIALAVSNFARQFF
jgi:hypothetical protein